MLYLPDLDSQSHISSSFLRTKKKKKGTRRRKTRRKTQNFWQWRLGFNERASRVETGPRAETNSLYAIISDRRKTKVIRKVVRHFIFDFVCNLVLVTRDLKNPISYRKRTIKTQIFFQVIMKFFSIVKISRSKTSNSSDENV